MSPWFMNEPLGSHGDHFDASKWEHFYLREKNLTVERNGGGKFVFGGGGSELVGVEAFNKFYHALLLNHSAL
jgi:hypothetical protein